MQLVIREDVVLKPEFQQCAKQFTEDRQECDATVVSWFLLCTCFVKADDSSAPPCFGDYFIFPTAVDKPQNDTM